MRNNLGWKAKASGMAEQFSVMLVYLHFPQHNPLRRRHRARSAIDHRPPSSLKAISHIVTATSPSSTRQAAGLAKIGLNLVAP